MKENEVSDLYLHQPLTVSIFRNDLYDNPYYAGAKLVLPAAPDVIQDTLDRARITSHDSYKILELSWNDHFYEGDALRDVTLEEVNFLASRLAELDGHFGIMYDACLQTKTTGFQIKDMINLTYVLDNCHVGYGIADDEALGHFAAENDFIEELADVPDEAWKYIDFEKVGKRMLELDEGVFIGDCYVACNISNIPDIYNGVTLPSHLPEETGIFHLLIDKAPTESEPAESQGKWLHLPASDERLRQMLREFNAQSYDECVCLQFDTVIPQIPDLFNGLHQLDALNALAWSINNQDQRACKAVLAYWECNSLGYAADICENLACFQYYPEMIHPTDFGKYHCGLHNMVSPDLEIYGHINFESYGRKQMNFLHVKQTPYGFVSRNDMELVLHHSSLPEQPMDEMKI